MPVAGAVPGEQPNPDCVDAAVGPVMLDTLPTPLVRVVGDGAAPGTFVCAGEQLEVGFGIVLAGTPVLGGTTPATGALEGARGVLVVPVVAGADVVPAVAAGAPPVAWAKLVDPTASSESAAAGTRTTPRKRLIFMTAAFRR